jgi:GT2 family glycosyltransferase
MRIEVVTVVAGRHDHLRLQLRGIGAGTRQPDGHTVVALADPDIVDICGSSADVLDLPVVDGRLPLARARNIGAAYALARGTDLLVFLDVDCVPGPELVESYADAADECSDPALLSGPVTYLPPPPSGGYDLAALPTTIDEPHVARPMPKSGSVAPLDHTLFWSLSFAATRATWLALGGFCEQYVGYGAEDTDLAERARTTGAAHLAVGGARAYHQWHPAGDPPLTHLEDIVRNGRIFRDRWGWWPMQGWLTKFRELGLVDHDAVRDDWQLTSSA